MTAATVSTRTHLHPAPTQNRSCLTSHIPGGHVCNPRAQRRGGQAGDGRAHTSAGKGAGPDEMPKPEQSFQAGLSHKITAITHKPLHSFPIYCFCCVHPESCSFTADHSFSCGKHPRKIHLSMQKQDTLWEGSTKLPESTSQSAQCQTDLP